MRPLTPYRFNLWRHLRQALYLLITFQADFVPQGNFLVGNGKYWHDPEQFEERKSISLIVDDLTTHKYVTVYGRAEIIEQNVGERARPIIKKYVPADKIDQWVQMINNDPKRVLVVLHPEKIITN